MGWAMTYLVHPVVQGLVGAIPAVYRMPLANLLGALFFLDLIGTLNNLLGFTQRLKKMQEQLAELRQLDAQVDWFDARDITASVKRLRDLCEWDRDTELSQSVLPLLDAFDRARQPGHRQPGHRLLHAFPGMRTKRYSEAMQSVRDSLSQRGEALRSRVWQLTRRVGSRSTVAGKTAVGTFVKQLDVYSLFWVFTIASLIGYLVETAFCLVTTGAIESRQGMLFGPFNQVYGFGAVLGGAFEALCSLVQEKVFGSISWQYDDHAFSFFGGRTSLLYMLFWGILGVWFMKGIYPALLRVIGRIPRRQGRALTVVLAVFLCVNMLLSATAVYRWSQRERGVAAQSALASFLDEQFPNDYMREVYPNMVMLEK